eukprot:snap_masked-scaffold_1-processed-gene-16.45-mRNA-1 protein AED:1.00 eAED:1.00 QI:0/0/0/0/1/1/2/0/161
MHKTKYQIRSKFEEEEDTTRREEEIAELFDPSSPEEEEGENSEGRNEEIASDGEGRNKEVATGKVRNEEVVADNEGRNEEAEPDGGLSSAPSENVEQVASAGAKENITPTNEDGAAEEARHIEVVATGLDSPERDVAAGGANISTVDAPQQVEREDAAGSC